MTNGSTHGTTVVGIILHADGTLRLFENSNGQIFAEVIGFHSDRGHRFLEQLGRHTEDICAEVCVCDDPEAYGLTRAPRADMHWRRAVKGVDAGGGTRSAPTGAPAGHRP
jgi:hypothetical protein